MARQGRGGDTLGGLAQGPPDGGGFMALTFLRGQGPKPVIPWHFGIPGDRGLVPAKAVLFGLNASRAIRWRVAGGVIAAPPPLAGPTRDGGLLQGVVQTRGILGHRLCPPRK